MAQRPWPFASAADGPPPLDEAAAASPKSLGSAQQTQKPPLSHSVPGGTGSNAASTVGASLAPVYSPPSPRWAAWRAGGAGSAQATTEPRTARSAT